MEYAWGYAAARNSRPFAGDFVRLVHVPRSKFSSATFLSTPPPHHHSIRTQTQSKAAASADADADADALADAACCSCHRGQDFFSTCDAAPLTSSTSIAARSRSHTSSPTPVSRCASCNKPLAAPAIGLHPSSTFPPPFQDQEQEQEQERLHQEQSAADLTTRTTPHPVHHHHQPGGPRPSDTVPPSRPNRKLGRHRLSAPLTSSTATSHPSSRHHHATMVGSESTLMAQTASTSTSLSSRTMMSTNDLASVSRDGETSSTRSQSIRPRKPFVTKSNGRTYLSDPTLHYPLPVDLHELHRQSLRTLLLFQLFGGPVCSPVIAQRPPTRVLDVACGYGFWSMMCHSYFSRKGYSNIHFTGIDIAPLGGIAGMPNPGNAAPPTPARDRGSVSSASGNWAEQPPDKNMNWNFVQHDLRNLPLPFADEEFDLIMAKECALVVKTTDFQDIMDEYLRVLKPGGVIEVWDCDHPIRMLRPHVPDTPTATTAPKNAFESEHAYSASNGGESHSAGGSNSGSNSNSNKKADQDKEISELGAYVVGNNTPLSGPQNNYLIEYNSWVLKYLESNFLMNWPCATIGPFLIQEPLLTNHGSKRLAIPLAEVRWEREGVGGVVTKDGKSYIDTSKAIGRAPREKTTGSTDGAGADSVEKKGMFLAPAQLALRQTALQTVLGFIEGMEPVLREASGKKQDEWDAWMGKLMKELLEKDGANCGECLEAGAWWSRKVQNPS